jgi:hypothetical protein
MVPSNVQRIYDEHISVLSAVERLRLVELITRGMALPETEATGGAVDSGDVPSIEVTPSATESRFAAGWQSVDRRGDFTEWRDRAL